MIEDYSIELQRSRGGGVLWTVRMNGMCHVVTHNARRHNNLSVSVKERAVVVDKLSISLLKTNDEVYQSNPSTSQLATVLRQWHRYGDIYSNAAGSNRLFGRNLFSLV